MALYSYLEDKGNSRRKDCMAGIKKFLDYINGIERINRGYTTPEEKDQYEKMGAAYLSDKNREYVRDLKMWKKHAKVAPSTLRTYLTGVKEFLETNGKTFTKDQNKEIRRAFLGGEEALTDAPDHALIRSFLEHCDVRMRAITLLLSSSGMRIGELLSITENQIDFKNRMIVLKATQTKTKKGRNVFFSKEAEVALNEFIKARPKFISDCNKKASLFKKATACKDDGRVFPYYQVTINRSWNRTLKRAGQNKKDNLNRVTFHPHSLRAFFSTELKLNKCPESAVEAMLGHAPPFNGAYDRYTPKVLQPIYDEYSPALSIGTEDQVRKTVSAIAEKATEQNSKIKELEQTIKNLQDGLKTITDLFVKEHNARTIAELPDITIVN